MNKKNVMDTNKDRDEVDMDKRMERMERDIQEIKAALLGNVIDGSPGLLGRVRERERTAENHDLRIVRLETKIDQFAKQKALDELEARVETTEQQLLEWRAQMKVLAWAAGGGGLGGVVALVWTLLQLFTNAGG